MRDDQLAALLDAAEADPEPVHLDGLRVGHDESGFAVETPTETVEGCPRDEAAETLRAHPRHVTNWWYWAEHVGHRSEPRFAFLRWIERAEEREVTERYDALADDGLAREWGELLVTARLDDDGERRYDLRHHGDAGAEVADLEVHEDPFEARDVVTFDERGRYRPLKTAPSLERGWAFPSLDGRALVETVEQVYPATIPNWHRERRGELDVTHWDETAARQTGIYGVVSDLPDEAVEWVAEACCVDSQCLKRREWDRSAEEPLSAERGDGAFPCREPCSLVVAAARKWTTLEREESRTYEFELTPSEKEQLEAIVDAVAEGETESIREADVYEGANRYRARYLRAKRFTDDGELPEATNGNGAESDTAGDDPADH
jgi:hypothetical protein